MTWNPIRLRYEDTEDDHNSDFYREEFRADSLENDEMNPTEAAFMKGWDDARTGDEEDDEVLS